MASLLPGKKRIRASFSMTGPSEELLEAYDNDVARAIRSNDVSKLKEFLMEDRCFEGVNRNGESLLHLACRRGDLKVVKFLVFEAAVKTDVLDTMGRTILHDALWRPRYQEAMELMHVLIRVVSPELLVAEDMRGHACFEYCRKEDHGEWVTFIKKYSSIIQRRAKLAGLHRRDSSVSHL